MRVGKKTAAVGGIGLIGVILAFVLGKGDPMALIQQLLAGRMGGGQVNASGGGGTGEKIQLTPKQVEMGEFVRTILGSTEDVWNDLMPRWKNQRYEEPTLQLFTDQTQTACGTQPAAVGPFYCPGDRKVYIDLSFYQAMKDKLNAPGDAAQAYVIAHEVGHHIQHLLGTSDEVHRAQRGMSKTEANELSVRLELQADYFAGVWAHHARKLFESGDLDEVLNAAAAIGDDRLARNAGRRANVESFTHGTSEQRMRWFRKGFRTGDPSQGDTFSGDY